MSPPKMAQMENYNSKKTKPKFYQSFSYVGPLRGKNHPELEMTTQKRAASSPAF
jgi:hypothetical protein